MTPGTIIACRPRHILHFGVVTESGTVLENARGTRGVAEVDVATFSHGAPIREVGYPSALRPETVVARGRALIGKRFDIVTFNCEHFVMWCHGLPRRSRSLRRTLGGYGVLAASTMGPALFLRGQVV